jgi:hypothetical protein
VYDFVEEAWVGFHQQAAPAPGGLQEESVAQIHPVEGSRPAQTSSHTVGWLLLVVVVLVPASALQPLQPLLDFCRMPCRMQPCPGVYSTAQFMERSVYSGCRSYLQLVTKVHVCSADDVLDCNTMLRV